MSTTAKKKQHPYEELLFLPRPNSTHPRMSLRDRATQFAPFAALNGYEDKIAETAQAAERMSCVSPDLDMDIC